MSKGEEMVSKVNYTLDSMMDKYEQLQNQLEEGEENRVKHLAELARRYVLLGRLNTCKKTKCI